QVLHRPRKWSYIEEHHLGDARETGNPTDLGPDVNVSLGPVRNDPPKGPGSKVDVVRVEARRGGLVLPHGPPGHDRPRLGAGRAQIAEPADEVPRIAAQPAKWLHGGKLLSARRPSH